MLRICVIGFIIQPVLIFLFHVFLPIREGHVWGKEITKGNMSSCQFPLILSSKNWAGKVQMWMILMVTEDALYL